MQKSFLLIPFVHLIMYVTIGLNIPVFRQVTVFFYLTFIPGFVLLKILKLKISVVDAILFSVGLSIAFLLFVGLLVNELFLALGVSQPLSTIPLEITLSLLTLILFLVGYRRDLSESLVSIRESSNLKVAIGKSCILVLPLILGIIGALYVDAPILLVMIFIVAALYAVTVFQARMVSYRWCPLVIFAISMALALQLLLMSRYIIGYDAQSEYYVFRSTLINGYWHLLPVGTSPDVIVNYNSMLSITMLPAIYSVLANINGELLFKVFYPFVFALVPVTLFRVYERQIGKSAALLSTLFLISGATVFYGVEPLSLNRQIVAELFLVLSIFVLLDKKISVGKRRLLIVVFGAALIVSHYSLGFFYLFSVFSVYVISKIKGDSDRALNSTTVFLLFILAFSWYISSLSPILSLSQFFRLVFSRFSSDIFSSAARSSGIFETHPVLSYASTINWALFYTVHFLVLVGIIVVLFKSSKTNLDPKYRTMAVLSAIILLLCVAVPNFAPSLNFTRWYAITMLFLAPCFVLGGETLVGISEKTWKWATSRRTLSNTFNKISATLLCVLIIGYFLSQSGFINYVTGASPLSLSLDYKRMQSSSDPSTQISFYNTYIPEKDACSAEWLSKNMKNSSTIYADYLSAIMVLTSDGLIPGQQISSLTNTTMLEQGGFVYLGQLNVVNGIMTTTTAPFNTSEIYHLLNETNLIYSNGNSEVWYVTSPG